MNRHYQTLELDKILELLAGQTNGPDAAQAARDLRPVPVLTAAGNQRRLYADGAVWQPFVWHTEE